MRVVSSALRIPPTAAPATPPTAAPTGPPTRAPTTAPPAIPDAKPVPVLVWQAANGRARRAKAKVEIGGRARMGVPFRRRKGNAAKLGPFLSEHPHPFPRPPADDAKAHNDPGQEGLRYGIGAEQKPRSEER